MRVSKLYIKTAHGEKPHEVSFASLITDKGIEGDVFFGSEDRQLCIISEATATKLQGLTEPCIERFSCNMIIQGDFLPAVGEQYCVEEAKIIITQVGRACHKICDTVNNGGCPLIDGTVFARIIRGGNVCTGDEVNK